MPTTYEVDDSVPRERSQGQDPEYEGQADADSIPSILDYPENPSVDLVIVDDRSWYFLSESCKLASNNASFSCVVNVGGIKTLEEGQTMHSTLVALADLIGDDTSEETLPIRDEVLQASLARTILPSVKETPVYRVSGVKPGSGKPKAKT